MEIQAIYPSFSTLVLLTLPITLWDVLPDHPAYSFIRFVTPNNLVLTLDEMDAWAVEKQVMLGPFPDFEVVGSDVSHDPASSWSLKSSRAPSISSASSWMSPVFPFSRASPHMDSIRELKTELQDLKDEYHKLRREHADCKTRDMNLEAQLSSVRNRLKQEVNDTKTLENRLWYYKSIMRGWNIN